MTQTQQQSLTEKVNASASDLTIGTIRLELKQFLNKMKSPSKHAKAMNLKLRSQNNHVIKVTLLIRRVLSGVDSAAAEEKLANLDVDCTYIGGTKDGGVQAHDDSRIDAAAASYLSPSAVRKARQLFKVMVTQTIDFTSPIPPPLAPPTTKEIEMMMKKRMKRRKRSRSKQQKKTLLPHGNQERDETRKVKSVGADDGEGNTKAAVVNRDDNSGEDEENEDNKNNDEYILEIEKENDMLAGLAEKLKTLTVRAHIPHTVFHTPTYIDLIKTGDGEDGRGGS